MRIIFSSIPSSADNPKINYFSLVCQLISPQLRNIRRKVHHNLRFYCIFPISQNVRSVTTRKKILKTNRTREMARRLRAPAALPEALDSLPSTHTHPHGSLQLSVSSVPGHLTPLQDTGSRWAPHQLLKGENSVLSLVSKIIFCRKDQEMEMSLEYCGSLNENGSFFRLRSQCFPAGGLFWKD